MTGTRRAIGIIACLVACTASAASISGRIKVDAVGYDAGSRTLEQRLGYRTSSELAGQLRVELKQERAGLQLDTALQLDGRHGRAVERDVAFEPLYFDVSPDESYWDLETSFARSSATITSGRLDRLNLSWSGSHLVLRAGRQALTWGSGLVFHPMDLVNPFQPVATDTAYKRGTDMGYGQWLFDDGSDVQFATVLRRRRGNPEPGAGQNTYAGFANIVGGTMQWTLLAARDRTDSVFGLGASRGLAGAVWNGELVATRSEQQGTRVSALTNVSWAGIWGSRNITLFAEYYNNGFGEPGRKYAVSQLDPDLFVRFGRGAVFVTGKDYLSLGATWEWTPLVNLTPTVIVNMRDFSALVDAQFAWSLTDNTQVKGGVRFGMGSRGTELRGLEIVPGSGAYLAAPDQVFVRLETWF